MTQDEIWSFPNTWMYFYSEVPKGQKKSGKQIWKGNYSFPWLTMAPRLTHHAQSKSFLLYTFSLLDAAEMN